MALSILLSPILAVNGLVSWLILLLLRRIYDVYFGPLSKIPGPKLAAGTRLVMFYHKIRGNSEHWRAQLHETYGHVVRPSPTEVSFSTGEVWKDIYGHTSGVGPFRSIMQKDTKFYGVTAPGEPVGLGPASDEAHTRQRKIFSAAFSERVLKRQEPLLRQYTTQLLSNLSNAVDDQIDLDIAQNYNFITFDIMADLTFGEPLGCLQKSAYTPWVSMIFASLTVLNLMMEMNHYPWAQSLIKLLIPSSIKKKHKQHKVYTKELVDKRMASEESRPDIWGVISDVNSCKPKDQQLQSGEMHANSGLFTIAGTETSATLMSVLTYYLLCDPKRMSILTSEIRSAFSSSEDITLDTVSHLPYLNACIQEGLRIHPPVPLGLPRLVPKGGIQLCGYYLPENVSVSVHQYSTYRSSRNFASPHSFRPERWLNSPPKEFLKDDRSAFHPFLVGPRSCLGTNLAWFEMRFILASVLFSYALTLCEESHNWADQKIYLMWKKDPLMVKLKRRHVSKTK